MFIVGTLTLESGWTHIHIYISLVNLFMGGKFNRLELLFVAWDPIKCHFWLLVHRSLKSYPLRLWRGKESWLVTRNSLKFYAWLFVQNRFYWWYLICFGILIILWSFYHFIRLVLLFIWANSNERDLGS